MQSSVDVRPIEEVLSWWGASTKQVEQAACKTKSPPGRSDIQALLEQRAQESKRNETVHGVRLQQEPISLVAAFKHLTTRSSVYGSSYGVKSAQVPVQSTYAINPECQKVLCAVEKIWGPTLGPKLLYMQLKHGYNGSELAFDEADRLKEEELNDILMTLEDLPPVAAAARAAK